MGVANTSDCVPGHAVCTSAASVLSLPRPAETFSVVICAYTLQRWPATTAAIRSVLEQTRRAAEIIVVVDHNDEVRRRLELEFPEVRVVANDGSPGVSGSRNCGVRHASTDVVAFLDDDAIAGRDWLALQAELFGDAHVLGVGGEVVPCWEGEHPRWFPDEFGWVVGYTHRGAPEVEGAVRNLTGGNMSVRRAAFDVLGGFRTALGLVATEADRHSALPAALPHGAAAEDTEFCIRALQRWPDAVWLYCPEVRIVHHVPRARATVRYFFGRCYLEGRSKACVAGTHVGMRDGLASERRYLGSSLPRGVGRHARDLIAGDPYGGVRAAMIVGGAAMAVGAYVAGTVANQLRQRTFSAGPHEPRSDL